MMVKKGGLARLKKCNIIRICYVTQLQICNRLRNKERGSGKGGNSMEFYCWWYLYLSFKRL